MLAAAGGFVGGALLGLAFRVLHGSWDSLGWVTPEARSTAPYWLAQLLAPVVVAAGWTALVLHARAVAGWARLAVGAAALELALFFAGWFPIALRGNGGVAVNSVAWLLLLVVMVGALAAAFLWPATGPVRNGGRYVVAGVALPIALLAGYALFGGPSL